MTARARVRVDDDRAPRLDLRDDLLLIDREGRTLCRHPLDAQPVALAVGALGSFAAVALANGTINGLGLPDAT